jgi:hypothetical protein
MIPTFAVALIPTFTVSAAPAVTALAISASAGRERSIYITHHCSYIIISLEYQ